MYTAGGKEANLHDLDLARALDISVGDIVYDVSYTFTKWGQLSLPMNVIAVHNEMGQAGLVEQVRLTVITGVNRTQCEKSYRPWKEIYRQRKETV